MKNSFLAISLILVVFSCTERRPDYRLDKPKDLVSKEKMISILLEARIMEAKLSEVSIKYDSAQKLVQHIYQPQILKKNNVQDSSFLKSYRYYLSDPDLMEEIYAAIIDSLSIKQKIANINK